MRIQKIFKVFAFLLCLIFSEFAFASSTRIMNLGEIANSLKGGADVLTHLMHIVCFVVGITLLVMSIVYFKTNRENPKFMPLDRVVLYAFCGIVLMAVPFFNQIFGETGSVIDLERRERASQNVGCDLDTPLDFGNNESR